MAWIALILVLSLSSVFIRLSEGRLGRSRVLLKDNGYEGVLIAIEDTLNPRECNEIISGLEETFRSSSSAVFKATRGRAAFRSITVLVPQSWNLHVCPKMVTLHNATDETWDAADFRVTKEQHKDFGSLPWSQQSLGCAQSGDYISLSKDFLIRNRTDKPGRLLAHVWLKYRYGVFEERGTPGDAMHPPHYRAKDAFWLANSCSNLRLTENGVCSPEDPSCAVSFVPEENKGLKSSFMAFPETDSVGELCDEGSHNAEAPTRHNLLCSGKSVWEILRTSPDFQSNRNVEGGFLKTDISFKYAQKTSEKIVILVEDTNVMSVQKRWDFVRKAVRKLVGYDVPDEVSVGLVVFDSVASVTYPVTQLLDGHTREKVGSSLPRNPSLVGEDRRCIICGLREAINILNVNEGSVGGHIVLIMAGSSAMSERESEEAYRLLEISKITLHSIVYPLTMRYPRPGGGLDHLAGLTGGRSFTVPDEGIGSDSKLSMYYNLLDALYHTLIAITGNNALPIKVHYAEHPGGILASEGRFVVDPSLGADFVFAIFYYNVAHVGNKIHLISPRGQAYDTVNMQKEDANINMIAIRLRDSQVIPGVWQYRVENRADSHQSLFVQVTARLRQYAEGSRIIINAWTSHPSGEVNSTDISTPLAVFVEARTGVSPLHNADVSATLTKLGKTVNGSMHSPNKVFLLDNGLLSPDIIKGDGVYSRIIVGMFPGKYSISITVEGQHNDNKFYRHFQLGVISIVGTTPTPQDVIPPARIVDFRVSPLPGSLNELVFTWTAPGNDYDYGRANRYIVLSSESQWNLRDGASTSLEGWPAPQQALTLQQHILVWKEYNEVSYVGIFAVDQNGNTSPLSNIVTVFVEAPPTTPAPAVLSSSLSTIDSSAIREGSTMPILATMDTKQLAVIFGCVGGFLIVAAAIVCYCSATSHRNNKGKDANKKQQEVQEGFNTPGVQKGNNFADSKDSIKREYISPVESWSASQLLSSQQDGKRGSVSGPSDNTSDHSGSTKKSYGGSSGHNEYYGNSNHFQFPHPNYSDQYPVGNENYPVPVEGTPVEGYVTSQPSDSFLSVSCDMLPSTHGPPGYSAYPAYDSSLRSCKVPPPIPPKPKVVYTPEPYLYDTNDSHSTAPSVASEKRIRNVTMV